MDLSYLLFIGLFLISLLISWLGWRNSIHYSQRAAEIGNMLMGLKGEVESDDEAAARVLKMTIEEYKIERRKGRVLYKAGMEVCGIAEGLKAPFRFWK